MTGVSVAALVVVLGACRAPLPSIVVPPQPGLVVELRDATYKLHGDRLAIYRGGALATTATSPARWTHATTIAAPDGEGRWVVALDERGGLVHITLAGDLAPVADQLGLAGTNILDVQGAGSTIATQLAGGGAVTNDGHHPQTFTIANVERIAVAPGVIALGLTDRTELWNVATSTRRRFALHAISLGFVDGALVATTSGGAYVERGKELVPARIVTARAAADDPGWRADVAPVFARVCSHCHQPGGDAGVDLSTPAAWRAARGELRHRVLDTQTMPPAGTDLTATERAAVARWLAAP